MIAAFDLDHTLFNANASYAFGSYLYRTKRLSTPKMIYIVALYFRHKFFGMSLKRLHDRACGVIFQGVPKRDLDQWVQAFLNESWDSLLFSPAVGRLEQLRAAQAYLVILSSSPDFLVRRIAERLGVDEWRGTLYRVDENDRIASVAELIDGGKKAKYLKQICCERAVPIQDTAAFSDSILDLPFLEYAGTAVAVKPDRQLLRHARDRDWEIIE